MKEILIGIDIGGTSIKMTLIRQNGELIVKWTIPTNKMNQGQFIIEDIWTSISERLKKYDILYENILGIGVGVPGFIDAKHGIVRASGNIGWNDYPIVEKLQFISKLPVVLENDANVAVIGEYWLGAGKNADPLLMVTLGTGVGGGIIIKSDIVRGANHMAGEIGHFTIEKNGLLCSCGKRGCLETIASATGIIRKAYELIETSNHIHSPIMEWSKNQLLTAKDVFVFAQNGDKICKQVIDYAAEQLGFVLAQVGTIINPNMIIIGGGVANAGKQLINLINKWFKHYSLPRIYDQCTIKTAQLGNDAGIYGAAYLVNMVYKTKKFTI